MDVVANFQEVTGQVFSHQATQFGIAFGLAALIHARQVKKEIALQMTNMTTGMVNSINNVAMALREDLKKQSDRLSDVEIGVQRLNNRVERLETKEK